MRHRTTSVTSADIAHVNFASPGPPRVSDVPPEQVSAYVAALEARCNMLWGYIQGYDCSCDPVVRFLATELGLTVDHITEAMPGPAAD